MNNQRIILMVSAGVEGSRPIEPTREYVAIDEVLRKSIYKNDYIIRPCFHATVERLSSFLEEDPWVIHYAGHASPDGRISLERKDQQYFMANTMYLLNLIKNKTSNVRCIFFSSCYSNELLLEAISLVDYAIGFEGGIYNKGAIKFGESFYRNLIQSQSFIDAFCQTQFELALGEETLNFKPVMKSRQIGDVKLKELQQAAHLNRQRLAEQEANIKIGKAEIQELEKSLQPLYAKALAKNPHYLTVLWFIENKGYLIKKLTRDIYGTKQMIVQEEFSDDLDMIFGYLESVIVTNECVGFTKVDFDNLRLGFEKALYFRALDSLTPLIPPLPVYTKEAKAFFSQAINYIKELMD